MVPPSANLGGGFLQIGIAKLNQVTVGISERVWNARHQLLAGAMGRCVAVSMMFPIDTVKTRLQMFGRDCCTVCTFPDSCLAKSCLRLCLFSSLRSG